MKDIKDYLHLYLGCEAMTGKQGKIVSVGLDVAIIVYPNEDPRGFAILKEHVKLILRPLSDMTEEEADHIGRMCFGKDSVKWRIEHKKDYLTIYRKHYTKKVTIDYASGDIDFYEGGDLDTSLNQTEIFRYLLSKGFDLFNLIPEGLAIDKTTLKI